MNIKGLTDETLAAYMEILKRLDRASEEFEKALDDVQKFREEHR